MKQLDYDNLKIKKSCLIKRLIKSIKLKKYGIIK